MKNRAFRHRLGFALSGLVEAFRRERSFRTQAAAAAALAAGMLVLRPGLIWGAVATLSAALVLSLELVNSAVESLIDHLHPDVAPEIKLAKDIAAGAVLVGTLGAVLIGILMMIDVLW